ncbi:MAG: hypothetical protein WAV56_01060 [Microgenomates group bacterium]
MRRLPVLIIFGLLLAAIALAAWFFLPKLTKPKEPTKIKEASNLFVYEDVINQKEPSFSLKLPDGWYRDLGVKGSERLLSFSPDRDNRGITYRAFITAGVAPTKLDLAGEVARARKDIGSFAVNNKFITDKSITVKGYPAHLLEYNTLLKDDSQNVEKILGKSGLLIHHTDIITVKNGYFIDVSAYAFDWAWPEFINVIEKSLNTISFSPN